VREAAHDIMPERARPSSEEPLLDLPSGEDGMSAEALENQVQKAQEALLSLKRQQDQIERQKRELEELSRRQEQLNQGRTEMLEKFTRAVVVLERETYEARKRVEMLDSIHESFTAHMDALDAINPRGWEGLDINKELSKALSAVDDARAEYVTNLPKISPENEGDGSDLAAISAGYQTDYAHDGPKDFFYWLKAGLAFTLPLLILGIIFLLVLISSAGHTSTP
jgi:predicted RNase H-like nuclease (RuvC/YqgF family)